MSLKAELENLGVGDTPDRVVWLKKGQSNISRMHLGLFQDEGITSREYKGKIFFMRSLKFFRPCDPITPNSLEIIKLLDEKNLSKQEPTRAEEEDSPFPRWTPPDLAQYIGGKRSRKKKPKSVPDPDPVPNPDPDTDTDSDSDNELLISIFDI